MTMRPKGSLAVLTRPVRGASEAIIWDAGTVVRIDRVHDLETMIYEVHNLTGTTARIPESGLRDVMPEDGEKVRQWEIGALTDEDAQIESDVDRRLRIAREAATILRARTIMNVGAIDAAQVVILAAYIEGGASPEMAAQIGEALAAAVPPVSPTTGDVGVEVEWRDPAPRDPRSVEAALEHRQEMEDEALLSKMQRATRVMLPDPLTVPAGDIAIGDQTEHWLVLDKVAEREKVTVRVALAVPKRGADRFVNLALLKSAPVEVLSRLATPRD